MARHTAAACEVGRDEGLGDEAVFARRWQRGQYQLLRVQLLGWLSGLEAALRLGQRLLRLLLGLGLAGASVG